MAAESGYRWSESWHDFLAYPLTGCYAGTLLNRWPGVFVRLMQLERALQRLPGVRRLCDALSWRLRMDIRATSSSVAEHVGSGSPAPPSEPTHA